MSKSKHVRRAEEKRKAKRKKMIVISSCSLAAVLIAVLIILMSFSNDAEANPILDLPMMSGTIAYATISNIHNNPHANVGTRIRAWGRYQPFFNDDTNEFQHFLALTGITGCCGSIIEFKLGSDAVFPADYPPPNAVIEIVGTFTRIGETGRASFYWLADDFTVLN